MTDTAPVEVDADELARLHAELRSINERLTDIAATVGVIGQQTGAMTELVAAVGPLVANLAPMAERLAAGGPGAFLALLGRNGG